MNQFISTLELYFGKKAPQLPTGFKEFIVKVAPYLGIIGIIIILPALFALLGLGTFLSTLPYNPYSAGYGGFGLIVLLSLVILVLYILALPGLFKRTPSGWNFIFYSVLVGGLQNIVLFNLGGLIIGLLIGFYLLFQIRPYYFGGASQSQTPPTSQPPSQIL